MQVMQPHQWKLYLVDFYINLMYFPISSQQMEKRGLEKKKLMAFHSVRRGLLALHFFFLLSLNVAARLIPNTQIRAVNLGGWLVTEGWLVEPSLFEGIPNNDFLDGTKVQLKSVTTGKYLSAESGGGSTIVANRPSASSWETFKLWRVNETTFQFRVFHGQFIGLDNQGESINVVGIADVPGIWETFNIVRKSDDPDRVRIQAPNGLFLQAKTEVSVTADASGNSNWANDDPSVFLLTKIEILKGEFQVTNGYGPEKAPSIMQEHWKNFIVEEDFQYISEKGLNAVRVPVGWWIASDPFPPWPFVAGSLEILDNAFTWAEKHGLKVIIDLHAAPGSQNGWEHSGTRDGTQSWGLSDESIDQTVGVIDFLSARYAKSPSLIAVELINEPLAPGVSLKNLEKYYKASYDAVRRYTSSAYVIMSNRLGPIDKKELLQFASGLQGSVIDVHYYNFEGVFYNMTAEENIQYVYTNRSAELRSITEANGPLIFIGEWVADWAVENATKEEYQMFAKAQLEVYGGTTFGWAYWNIRAFTNQYFDLEWMINNGYISL